MQIDTEYYRQQITALTGIENIDHAAIRKFEFYINRASHLKEVRYAPFFPNDKGRAVVEKFSALWALIEGYKDKEIACNTYGRYLPSYAEMLKLQGEPLGNTNHRSLLVGAISVLTVSEYCKVVRNAFPQAECSVVDLEGIETARISEGMCDFRIADALHLPFKDYFNSIHTNFLIGKIEADDASETFDQRRQEFYVSARQALKTGGALLMVEPRYNLFPANSEECLMGDLKEAGFSDLTIYPAVSFIRRRILDQCLQNASLSFDPIETKILDGNYGLLAVRATKSN